MNEDTISALSTSPGTGGIGIIRISGDKAFDITNRLFKGKKNFNEIKTHTISYGKIIDPFDGTTVDEALVSKMKKPNTYTREDIVEINCHGGHVVLSRILELVMKLGARPAEPGEFTKRAFLNGRIDLSEAEAVIDLIYSKTRESSRAAVDQLEGRLSVRLKEVRSKLVELIAHIEVTVDYPEHDIEEITGKQVYEQINTIINKLNKLLEGFEKGRILREGVNAVILGRPNVGKSSLLNELTGKSKAIVTDIPGTTRDIIEEYINIEGIPVKIIDTAGLSETENPVEKIGVERAKEALEASDLAIVMLDASQGLSTGDVDIIERTENKKAVYVINKTDLASEDQILAMEEGLGGKKPIHMSIVRGQGVEELEKTIAGLLLKGELNIGTELLVTNIRHKNLIDKAIQSLDEAVSSYENGMPLDLVTIDIKNAAEYIGEITGESVGDDVLKEIFSRFCIGK